MQTDCRPPLLAEALSWAYDALGPVEVVSDHSREHPDHESSTCRLVTPSGRCYLKVHSDPISWQNEVHAYECWARAFGDRAPRLLAVREAQPPALIITELPGRTLESAKLSPEEERGVWRAAGAALVALHNLEVGPGFGSCLRDGTPIASTVLSPPLSASALDPSQRLFDPSHVPAVETDAVAHVAWRFSHDIERAVAGGYIDHVEQTTVRRAYDLIPAFAGEQPTPCHRDYCAVNLMVDDAGAWAGVIDFEFARWDVRVADFTRDPEWAWVVRPDLYQAFIEGYGRSFTPAEDQQLLVAHAEYALGAVLWGRDSAFYGFEREGHEALSHLARLLG